MIRKPKIRMTAIGVVAVAWTLAIGPVEVSRAFPLGDVDLPSGKENTSVIVQNAGTEPATIVMDVYRPDGTIVPGATREEEDVPVGGTRNFPQSANENLDLGFRGLGVVSASEPVNALIVRDILNSAGLKSYSIASGAAAGGRKLAIPIAFNELLSNQWNSRVAVVNAGTQTSCVKVTYFPVGEGKQPVIDQPTGQPGCPGGGHAVPVAGQITLGRTGTNVTRFPEATDNNQMAILIEVLNAGDNNVAANVDIYRSDGNRLLGAYEGLVIDDTNPGDDDVGTNIIVPLAIKSQSGFYSVIGVLNVGDGSSDVQIRYQGVDGNQTAIDHTVTLQDVTNVGVHSIYSSNEIPLGFIGYATVTSSQPMGAVLIRGKQTTAFSGVNEPTYSAGRAVPVDQAGLVWNLPLIFRRLSASGSFFGYNSWIQVQVPDGSTAQVTLRFVGDPVFAGDCPTGPFEASFPVNGSKVFLMNAESDNGFPPDNAPICFFGGAQVIADKNVIVISNVTADHFGNSDADGLYNGFR